MKQELSRARAAKGPAPLEAGANLTIHDLKNLAGRLAVLCQNLDEHYQDPLFKETALDVLSDTVSHLQRLARDLRDREGRVIIKLQIDLNETLQDALLDTRPDLAGEVRLVQHYSVVPLVWGDRFLLRRAFACAIENSLEAMKGDGILSVATASTRRRGQRRVIAEIADNGPGMSEQFLRENLFHPFSSTKEDGLGLGVYTIRQVVALHGATVRIMSAERLGTRVRFSFPAEGS